jgi:hypothetical protein
MEYLKVTKVDDVIMYRRGNEFEGTLHLTTHHIIFTMKPEKDKDGNINKKSNELWFCYPMIERVDFNRGSAMLYKFDPDLIDLNGNIISSNANAIANGIAESITSSSLATTATEFTNSLSNGFGFGNVIGGSNNNNNNNNNNPSSKERSKELEINNEMIQLSLSNTNNNNKIIGVANNSTAEKIKYELEAKQRKLLRGASIRIQFRDFNYISFDFKNILKGNDVFDSMLRLTCINNIEKLYAFIYQPVYVETKFNSWNDYNLKIEFERQGLNLNENENGGESESQGEAEEEKTTIGCKKWRITNLNKNYELCESYPKQLIIPKSISDTVLSHTVKYRSKNRFPTLSYYYKKNGCTIIRCSQPLVGIKQNRSIQDENLIQEIFETNNLKQGKNLIVDARPLTNAMAQVALGAGTEIMDNYGENNKKIFLNIENIHVMRDSLNKIKLLLKNSDVNGTNIKINKEELDKSGWLDHIIKLLKATDLLVKHLVFEEVHLIIHCSDGWDRTSQICSLIELCIDPFYRTLEGFIILIEKEWISFGHRFNERCGHFQRESKFYNNTEEGNFKKIKNLNQRFKHQQNMKFESPIFHQFLDCVYQIMRQYPKKFEFNERFLRRLVYHLYSCQYGTFLVDKEKEKYDLELETKTRSVWDYFKSRKSEFTNRDYITEIGDDFDILDVNYTNVIWWREVFGRDM